MESKNYRCQHCSKNYTSYTSLYYHRKTKHELSSNEVKNFYTNERSRKKSKTNDKTMKGTPKATGDKKAKRQTESMRKTKDQVPAKTNNLQVEGARSHLLPISGTSGSLLLDDLMPMDISETLQDMCDALVMTKEDPWKNVVIKVSDIKLQGKITKQLLKDQYKTDKQLFQIIHGNITPTQEEAQDFSTICCAVRRSINSTIIALKTGIEDLIQPR